MHSDLPLFSWIPPRKFIPFPMTRRVGKIRDTAVKMLDKQTERAAEHYYTQVTDGLVRQLQRIGLPEIEIDEQIGAFWSAVHQEMTRLSYHQNTTGGGAA